MTIIHTKQATRTALVLVLLIIGMVLVSGCTSSTTVSPATTTVTTTATSQSTSAAGTTASAAATTSSSGTGAAVQAVDFNKMVALIPAAPAGWEADGSPSGLTMKDSDGHPWTMATGSYTSTTNKDTTASITYQDTADLNVGFKNNWNGFQSMEGTDGYFKSTMVKGNPAWEMYSKPDTYGGWISVNDRFMVYVSVDKGTKADYDTMVNAIDFAGIAALK